MRTLTINETWDYTKRMWEWIAIQKEVLEDERSVDELKEAWLVENAPEFVDMPSGCFFCAEKRLRYGTGYCNKQCAGSLVEEGFSCCDPDHYFVTKPGAFYREILRLDDIRTTKPSHVWEHGDVFQSGFSHHYPMVYLEINGEPYVFCLAPPISGPSGDICGELIDAVFLFNIGDKR